LSHVILTRPMPFYVSFYDTQSKLSLIIGIIS